MKKRLLALILVLSLTLSCLASCNVDELPPISGSGSETPDDGNKPDDGDKPDEGEKPDDGTLPDGTTPEEESASKGLTYELSDDGTYYTVTGIGECTDTELLIPSEYKEIPVTNIAKSAFQNCTNLISVTIPDSVTSIGDWAFRACTNLTNVTIGIGVVTNIRGCFDECPNIKFNEYDNAYYLGNEANPYRFLVKGKDASITSVNIHEKTEIIEDNAFMGYTELVEIAIPDSVKAVGSRAFYGCSNLRNVDMGVGVTRIDEYAFAGCTSLANISIPDSLEECGSLFGMTNISQLVYTAYDNCTYLGNEENPYVLLLGSLSDISDEETIVHENTRVIAEAAFKYYNVKSILIPKSVISIGREAFQGGVDSVYIEDLTAWCNIKFSNYSSNPVSSGAKLYLNETLVEEVVIPESITAINEYAFYGYKFLKNVVIGNDVIDVGKYAFSGCESLASVTIPDSVTSIGDRAFTNCKSLTSVVIPDSVTSIGDYAFLDCTSLTSVTIPDSVTSIGSYAFQDCTSLTSVTIPDSVTSIGDFAFYGCESLTSVTIPDSVTSIGDYAFSGCTGLSSVSVGNSVEVIGVYSFANCDSLTNINISDNVKLIENTAFRNSPTAITVSEKNENLTEINGVIYNKEITKIVCVSGNVTEFVIPKTINELRLFSHSITKISFEDGTLLDSIDSDSFSCPALEELVIAEGITSIGSQTFMFMENLRRVSIPNSIKTISKSAFDNCLKLQYNSNKGLLYLGNESNPYVVLIGAREVNVGNLQKVSIHEDTKIIYPEAFRNCRRITDISIPEGVTSIGSYAFSGCTSLESVTIPDSVTSIGDAAFSYCTSLTTITIPDSATFIGNYAFLRCDSLEYNEYENAYYLGNENNPYILLVKIIDDTASSVIIHNNVKFIHSNAFSFCINLCNITISENIKSIASGAFEDCYKLVEVYNLSSLNIEKYSKENGSIGYHALNVYTATNGEKKTWETEDGFIFYEDGDTCYLLGYKGTETDITLPENCNGKNYQIYTFAFAACSSLTRVVIPDSVTSIGDRAFKNCKSLTSVTIPDSVTSIGYWAFSGCTSLTSVVIGEGITSIGDYAFSGCTSLQYNEYDNAYYLGNEDNPYLVLIQVKNTDITSVTIHGDAKVIGDCAFSGCTSLESVTIPDSITSIGHYAFGGCSSLTSVTIPDSVTTIGSQTFGYCTSLESITFSDTSTWYRTGDYTNWENKTDGTETDVTDSSANAAYFTEDFFNCWYKL